jgi:hypothetical protein
VIQDNAFRENVFEKCAREPWIWIHSAENLKTAANVILRSFRRALKLVDPSSDRPKIDFGIGLFPEYLWLAGLALENLMKGLCIARNPALVGGGQIENWGKAGHDLNALARKADLTLSDQEKEILGRLAEYVRWAGKYPLPYSASQSVPHPLGAPEFDELVRWDNTDPARIEALFERLRRLLQESKRSPSK